MEGIIQVIKELFKLNLVTRRVSKAKPNRTIVYKV